MKIKLQPNETPGWIGLIMEAMLSGYLMAFDGPQLIPCAW
jgi:hypothetical protein